MYNTLKMPNPITKLNDFHQACTYDIVEYSQIYKISKTSMLSTFDF